MTAIEAQLRAHIELQNSKDLLDHALQRLGLARSALNLPSLHVGEFSEDIGTPPAVIRRRSQELREIASRQSQ